ncbi:MAG TPA: hypothetical protein VKF36_12665 [Syntrophorhabdales bacterium]|nr:hypothetical protein [Syntrophorhabdales bacterium]
MVQLIQRILSLMIAIGYVVSLAIAFHGFGDVALKICVLLLFPLALIWFPDAVDFKGWGGPHGGTVPTPAILLSIAGWLILIGGPVLLYCLWKYAR